MKKARKKYSPAFKKTVVAWVFENENSISAASRHFDVSVCAIRRWVNQSRSALDVCQINSMLLTPEQQEIQNLKAQIGWLEKKYATLKQAVEDWILDNVNKPTEGQIA